MRQWTKKEINFILLNKDKLSIIEIAVELNRTYISVYKKIVKLNIRMTNRRLKPKLNIGEKYGLFTIIDFVIKNVGKNRQLYYVCECECKRIKEVPRFNLVNGFSNSCGCVARGKNILPPGEATLNEKYATCRHTAKLRNLEFNLTKEEYVEIVKSNCYYCGEPPSKYNKYLRKDGSLRKESRNNKITQFTIDRAWVNINTVDRIDSDVGYTVTNCVPACWPCNEMKMDSNINDFIKKIYKIVDYQTSKGKTT